MKITGFDQLQRQLADAQKAFAELDGNLTTVQYDPEDPGSIEVAIQTMEQAIDEKVGQYANNPFVAPLIEQAKEDLRAKIIQEATEARLGKNERVIDESSNDDQ